MLYDVAIKSVILDALNDRVLSITDVITKLLEEGYIPNKAKSFKVQVGLLLLDAYLAIDVFDKEQHQKIDNIYNKFIAL